MPKKAKAEAAEKKRTRGTRRARSERAKGGASSGMRKRHSKAMRATRRHVQREVGIGMRLPADHDEIAGEVAEQNVVLDLRVLCGTGHAEAHVPVR